MLDLYYLVLWKSYQEKKNIKEPSLIVIHLRKLISSFYKKHPKKLIAISLLLDFAPSMARSSISKELKQKCGYLNKKFNKRGRN